MDAVSDLIARPTGVSGAVPADKRQAMSRPVGAMAKLLIVFLLAVPFLPRPTVNSPLRWAAPLLAAALLYAALMQMVARRTQGSVSFTRIPTVPLALLVVGTLIYVFRVGFIGHPSEYAFAASRCLMVGAIVGFFVLARELSLSRSLHWLTIGIVLLSVLALFVGVTGYNFLEAPRPARTFGIRLPWYKTAGVPRSFGEQGIFYAVALAYFLGYKTRFPAWARFPIIFMLLGGAVVSQSRNVYLTVAAVFFVWFIVAGPGRYTLLRWAIVAASVSTIIVEFLISIFASAPVFSQLISDGVYEENVYARFNVLDRAADFIADRPLQAILGFDHYEWRTTSMGVDELGLHNNMAASLLHLGLVAGTLTLLALFFIPAFAVISQLRTQSLTEEAVRVRKVVLTALAGTLVSLNFYEGFFSLVLAFLIAILWILSSLRPNRCDT